MSSPPLLLGPSVLRHLRTSLLVSDKHQSPYLSSPSGLRSTILGVDPLPLDFGPPTSIPPDLCRSSTRRNLDSDNSKDLFCPHKSARKTLLAFVTSLLMASESTGIVERNFRAVPAPLIESLLNEHVKHKARQTDNASSACHRRRYNKGEVAFITAAGVVGFLVIQFAKRDGLIVIASGGSDEKVAFMKEIGANIAFNYKTTKTSKVLAKEGPIDIYWDNVGGETLNECGMISCYNAAAYPIMNLMNVMTKEIKMYGFVMTSILPKYRSAFNTEIPALLASNKLVFKEELTKVLKGSKNTSLRQERDTPLAQWHPTAGVRPNAVHPSAIASDDNEDKTRLFLLVLYPGVQSRHTLERTKVDVDRTLRGRGTIRAVEGGRDLYVIIVTSPDIYLHMPSPLSTPVDTGDGTDVPDRGVFDFNEELESITLHTLLEPDWEDEALLSGTHHLLDPAIPFATLPTHFQSILYAEANAWTFLAQDCVIALVNDIICNRLSLHSLVDTALILRVETVTSTITSVIDRHCRAGIQVPSYVPDLGDIASQPGNHGYVFLVVRGASFSFKPSLTPICQSYPFLHIMQGSIPQNWFANPTLQHILRGLLADTHCLSCISVQEITRLPTQPDDIFLVHPAELCIGEKIAFCLAWPTQNPSSHNVKNPYRTVYSILTVSFRANIVFSKQHIKSTRQLPLNSYPSPEALWTEFAEALLRRNAMALALADAEQRYEDWESALHQILGDKEVQKIFQAHAVVNVDNANTVRGCYVTAITRIKMGDFCLSRKM
ncbi:hypothetical protein EV363DRAFT_1497586 [Boletus edulis]|nr:hypothetical protein EV363DRAFT_1497586 [Boletus edulis]